MVVLKSDLCFGIAGRAWAAVDDDGNILDVIPMGGAEDFNGAHPRIIALAGRKRFCPASMKLAEKLSRESFLRYRQKSRAQLAKLGKVVSGVASCGEFVI